jgi:hypothetical protein
MKKWVVGFVLVIMVTGLHSCSVYKLAYSPNKKYPKEDLQKDLSLLRQILEKKHPSLYWYTTKDSMDVFFDQHYALIKDSMNEQQFTWQVLAPLVDKIHFHSNQKVLFTTVAFLSCARLIGLFLIFVYAFTTFVDRPWRFTDEHP